MPLLCGDAEKEAIGGSVINNRSIMAVYCIAFAIYSITVYSSGTAATPAEPMSEQARHGKQLFQDKNCIACHQFYGLGGYMGPDLTNVISKRGEAYAGAFIAAGTVSMPNLGLDSSEVSAVVAYLAFVDQTGTYPPEDYTIEWTGNVSQADDPQ